MFAGSKEGGRREGRDRRREGRREERRKIVSKQTFLTGGHQPNSACRYFCLASRVLKKKVNLSPTFKNQAIAQTRTVQISSPS